MNKKIALLFISVLCMSFTLMAQRKSVAILETYCADGKLSSAYLMMIGSNIETGIIKNPGYTAYNRAQLKSLMNEHSFQRSGMVPDDQIKKLGQMAGVDYVLASEAALLDQQVFVTAKVLNVETGQYEMSDNELMDYNPSAIQRGCQNLAAKLLGGGSTPQEVRAQSTNPVSNSDYQATNISGRNVGLPQPNKDIAVKEGLVAYWTFDNGTGNDASDNGIDGNIIGNTKFINETPNGYGKALMIKSGRGEKFVLPQNFDLSTGTITFWIKDFTTGSLLSLQSGNSFSIMIKVNPNNTISYIGNSWCDKGGYTFEYDAKPIMASGWHHIAIKFGRGQVYLYVDGSLKDNGSFNITEMSYQGKLVFGGAVSSKSIISSMDLDGGSATQASDAISMKIDGIRRYKRYLTDAEIREIYNSEK